MQETLEQELSARIFLHKTSIVGGFIANNYIEEQKAKGGASLPEHVLQEQAGEHAQQALQKACLQGNLNNMYEEIWATLSSYMPEDMKVI